MPQAAPKGQATHVPRTQTAGGSSTDLAVADGKVKPLANIYEGGCYWQMKRYFNPNKKDGPTASAEALKIFNEPGGSKKVKEMLIASGGNFQTFELEVKKTVSKTVENDLWGQYVTETFLSTEKGWDTDMIEHSKNWAKKHGHHRYSEIHGKEEWKIPLVESFKFSEKQHEETNASTSTTGQDPNGEMLNFNLSMDRAMTPNGNGNSNGSEHVDETPAPNKKGGSKTLPMVQRNNPFSQLGSYITILGARLDTADEQKERIQAVKTDRANSTLADLDASRAGVEKVYNELLDWQQKLVGQDDPSKQTKDELIEAFVRAMQADLKMQNSLNRARNCKAPREAKAKAVAPKRKAAEELPGSTPCKRRKKKRGGASSAPSPGHPTKKVKKTKKTK